MAVVQITAIKTWEGDEHDEKPRPGLQFDGTTPDAADLPTGSRYTVRDTGEEYRWDGVKWVIFHSPITVALEKLRAEVEKQTVLLQQLVSK